MRIGYVGSNLTLGTKTATFRLAGFTPERAREVAEANLAAAMLCLEWNAARGIGFFRLSSQIVPFASHPDAEWAWREELAPSLRAIGAFANSQGMRLGTHPGQYTLPNSPRPEVVEASILELAYHSDMLDLMELPADARVQIHVGGVYGDREASLQRWVEAYRALPEPVVRRMAVENDERLFGLSDCLRLHGETGVPVIFDVFHHALLNTGEALPEAYERVRPTWNGLPMQLDYSSQNADRRFGAHTETLDEADFAAFLVDVPDSADVMLEIKDKETSAMKALSVMDPARGPYVKPDDVKAPNGRQKKPKKAAPTEGDAPAPKKAARKKKGAEAPIETPFEAPVEETV